MFDTATEGVYITKQGATKNTTLVTSQEAISTQKHKCKVLLRIASEIDFPTVRTFLESVARNSRNSKATYETGLKHFQRFLVRSTSTSNNYQNYNVETIIPAIQAGGSINVYELMDGLVSYFVVQLSHKQHIAPTSIFLYVHAVKSYLLYHDIVRSFRRPDLFSSSNSSTSNIFRFLLSLHLIHLACGFVNSLEPDKKAISVLLKIREVTHKSTVQLSYKH